MEKRVRFDRLEDDFDSAPRNDRRKLYLHIGMPKTGSTAIEMFFQDNRNAFRRKGVLYPVTGNIFFAHHAIPLSILDPNSGYGEVKNLIHYLRNEINCFEGDKIVLSSEHFFGASIYDKECYKSFLNWINQSFDVQVIIYFRDQNKLLSSLYCQFVEHSGFKQTYSEMISDQHYQTFPDAERERGMLRDYFDDEQIVLRCFDSKYFVEGDLVKDFLSIIDCSNYGLFFNKKDAPNPSLNKDEAEFCRVINALELNFDGGARFRKVYELFARGKCRKNSHLEDFDDAPHFSNYIAHKFHDNNIKIEKKYLRGDVYFSRPEENECQRVCDHKISSNNFSVYLRYLIDKSDMDYSGFEKAAIYYMGNESLTGSYIKKLLVDVLEETQFARKKMAFLD